MSAFLRPLLWLNLLPILLWVSSGFFLTPVNSQTEESFYAPQSGTPVGFPNFTDPESGCNWLGIAGQVFDLDGNPIPGLIIKIEGTLEGNDILLYAVTGGALTVGPGGYLAKLADLPVASQDALFLQVLNISGDELTPPIQVKTYSDCQRNLILVNVKESILQNAVFFPVIRK
jgi:hypothetical protein